METMIENKPAKLIPKGIVIKEDEQEKEFAALLRLWIENKIAYERLLENMPDQYKSKWKMFLKKLFQLEI